IEGDRSVSAVQRDADEHLDLLGHEPRFDEAYDVGRLPDCVAWLVTNGRIVTDDPAPFWELSPHDATRTPCSGRPVSTNSGPPTGPAYNSRSTPDPCHLERVTRAKSRPLASSCVSSTRTHPCQDAATVAIPLRLVPSRVASVRLRPRTSP